MGGMVLVLGVMGLVALTVFVYRWYHHKRVASYAVQ